MPRLGLLSDVHLAGTNARPRRWHHAMPLGASHDLWAQALERLSALSVDAIIVAGDLSDQGDEDTLRRAVEALAATGLPCWLAPGNHDIADRSDALNGALEVVSSDLVRQVSAGGAPCAPHLRIAGQAIETPDGGHHCLTADGADTSAWADDLVLWVSHHPVLPLGPVLREAGLQPAGDLADQHDVRQRLQDREEATLVICGHEHVRAWAAEGPLGQWSQRALIEPPHELGLLDISQADQDWYARFTAVALALEPSGPLTALCEPTLAVRWSDDGWQAA
jgi:hypothetical protein